MTSRLGALRAWLLVAAVGVGGCASVPLTCPARGGSPWHELASPHFVLRTDHGDSAARDRLEDLEQRAALLGQLAFPSLPPSTERLDVVLFEHEADFAQLFPERVDVAPDLSMLPRDRAQLPGFFGHQRDMEQRGELVSALSDWGSLQHELVHWFMSRDSPQAPRWLNEGLAQFYETLEIDYQARELIVGRPPFVGPRRDWPTAEELIKADGTAFYDRRRAYGFYSAAWVMVHLLSTRYPEKLSAYRAAIRGGEGTLTAWRAVFGEDWKRWNEELAGYVLDVSDRPDRPLAKRVPLPALPFREPEWVRPLTDEAVHLLWARLRSWDGAAARARVKADLDEAAAAAPDSAEVAFWRARFAQHCGRLDEADTLARASLARHPDARALYLVTDIALDRQWRLAPAARDLELVAPLVERLVQSAPRAHALDLAARYESVRGRFAEAIAYGRRAVAADPSCWSCFDGLAQINALSGALADAVTAEEWALGLFPEQEVPTSLLHRLRVYRQRLSAREEEK